MMAVKKYAFSFVITNDHIEIIVAVDIIAMAIKVIVDEDINIFKGLRYKKLCS